MALTLPTAKPEVIVHCATCHRVERLGRMAFLKSERKLSSWHLGEVPSDKHYCTWRCFRARDRVKLIRDPLVVATPLVGCYEFKLGFRTCIDGYGALSRHPEYQRGYSEALALRNRYYTRPEKRDADHNGPR